MTDLSWTIEDRGGVAVLVWADGGCRPAQETEIEAWNLLHPTATFSPMMTEAYSRGGSTICDKHDYLYCEIVRLSKKPQLVAMQETLLRMTQVCRAAKRDGRALEKGLQRRGEECNNLEDAADALAKRQREVLQEALAAVRLRREERRGVAESAHEEPSIRATAAVDVEGMDRLAAEISRGIEDLAPFILEGEKS